MSVESEIYDLGEAEERLAAGATSAPVEISSDLFSDVPPPSRPARPRVGSRAAPAGRWDLGEVPALTGTLSLLLPGAGQMLRRELPMGVLFLSWVAFLTSLGWALIETLDRAAGTLTLLGHSVGGVFWALAIIWWMAGAIHVGSVVHAARWTGGRSYGRPHPLLAGAASCVIPGWGQVLNGDTVRAALFLGALWIVGSVWAFVSPQTTSLLDTFLPAVSPWEQFVRQPEILWAAQWTAPCVIWSLAVYDATASAIHRR